MSTTTSIITSAAAEINRLHAQAQHKATEAISHALAAGKLLREVKATIGHGGWCSWLQENVSVTPRQAQRYMALANGKPMPIRAISKNDTVSHLPERQSEFLPAAGCLTYTGIDDRYFLVEQSTYPNHYFVTAWSLVGADDATCNYTIKPVRIDHVEIVLQQMGLERPCGCAWKITRIQPVGTAMGVSP